MREGLTSVRANHASMDFVSAAGGNSNVFATRTTKASYATGLLMPANRTRAYTALARVMANLSRVTAHRRIKDLLVT